ncbi:MAG: SDR family NAD(P)-dependent oxidoreductase [Alphaproteobacteria bacterium]|jgi:NAD(P)-dependent dehydrogenase (short-subunit alcohol dehydrogenase family)
MRTAIVIGVGPVRGLGAQLCIRLAAEGLHVFVAGRTQASLDAVVEAIADAGGQATSIITDATNEQQVISLFDQAGDDIDIAVYNAGNNSPGRIIDMTADYFTDSWRVVCFGAFLFGREAVRRMTPAKHGTLLFTGASASLRGRAGYGAFNSSKAALRNLAQAMAKEYAPDGVHVGHVVIDGPIGGDKIFTRRPDIVEKVGEDALIAIDGLVDGYMYLYRQQPTAWSFEIDVRTSKENW